MAHSTGMPPRGKSQKSKAHQRKREQRAIIPPTMTLAAWRLRQTWRLLLVTGLGMVAAVTLVCTAPLFSQITLTAGLRGVLTATPQDSELTLHASAPLLSTDAVAQDTQALDGLMQQQVGTYLGGPPQFSIHVSQLDVDAFNAGDQLQLLGASISAGAAHLKLMQGRLPQTNRNELEIAITPTMAQAFKNPLGTMWTTTLAFFRGGASGGPLDVTLPIRVVGIFSPLPDDRFWRDETFDPIDQGRFITYQGLMSNDGFLAVLTHLDAADQFFIDKPDLLWYYKLNVSHIQFAHLDDLINGLNAVQFLISQQFAATGVLNGTQLLGPAVELFGSPSTLEKYRDRVSIVQIPVHIVAIQVFCLVVYFVSMMADLLVDRQAEVIALLRSRGAYHRQVFGSFVNQGLGLGLIALVFGPLLAIVATRWLTQATLTPADQGALNIIAGNPISVALSVGWYALAASLGAFVAMIVAVRSSASRDVLEMRRESARATRRPLWQLLYLDMVAAIIALTGYGISFFITHAGVLDTRVNLLISAPLALVAPIFLVIAGVLFFLRFFPVLLRQALRFTARRPGAAPMLALAQMARAPRQAMRMVLLLSLASGFAILTLVFTASQSQQIYNVAANQTGADFSGAPVESSVPDYTTEQQTLAQRTAAYRQIPGVLSATLGYAGSSQIIGGLATIPLTIRAVDTHTFAQTALWTDQDSSQSLSLLMSQLAHYSSGPLKVPAIFDALAWNALHLTAGETVTLTVENDEMSFVVIAEVQHIPTVNDSLDAPGTSDYTPPGGVLVDYQKLAKTYGLYTEGTVPLNYAWLRTSNAPASLAKVRAALNAGPLALESLNDRRAMIANLQHDPLYLNLVGMLTLGALATVLLALLGNLIASWLSARNRLRNFAVLRALGSAPRQIASVLVWEQGIVYAAAIGLGIVFGAILVLTIVPALVFTGAPNPAAAISSGEFYVIQHVLPIQIIVSSWLGLVFAALILICVVALWLMARVVSRPSISQTLRLNED